jgi:Mg/Co/Ni transporter MgtE
MPDVPDLLLSKVRRVLEGDRPSDLPATLKEVHAEDLAEVLDLLEPEQRVQVISSLDDHAAARLLSLVEEAVRVPLLESLPDERLLQIVADLPPDDAADMVAELPKEESAEILEKISQEKSAAIEDLLTYPPETAGGVMTPAMLSLQANATVQNAIDWLRGRDEVDEFVSVYLRPGSDHAAADRRASRGVENIEAAGRGQRFRSRRSGTGRQCPSEIRPDECSRRGRRRPVGRADHAR